MKANYKIIILVMILIISMFTGCATTEPDETMVTQTNKPTAESTIENTTEATEATTTPSETKTIPDSPDDIENGGIEDDPSKNMTEPTQPAPTESAETKHEHNYNSKVTKPTCESDGYTTYTCSCGDSYTSNETKATGHSYKTETVAPTTETKGYDIHTCAKCNKSYKDNYTSKLPAETKPTEHTHEWKTETVKATCVSNGYDILTCSCGEERTDNHVSATGHDMQTETVIAPTTEAQGYTIYKCKNCNYTENRDYTDKLPAETIPETTVHEHTWSAWEWTGENNYYGEYIRTCTVCNETDHPDTSSSYAVPEVVTIINEYRAAEGLSPLSYDSSGQDIANLRAAELQCEFRHHTGNFNDNGFYKGECIASGQRSAQSVVDAWMESSSHRPSLMNPDATKAVVARNGNCWVIAFG